MRDLISIIIPVYNAANYLDDCLVSVLNQTYRNLEIICVNDGSTDNSLKILNKYATKDNRIVVCNKKNGGASSARNFGMENATGKYFVFVDSDDTLENNMCEMLLSTIYQEKADACFCSYNSISSSEKIQIYNNEKTIINYSDEQIKNNVIYNAIYVENEEKNLPLYAVWNGIYSVDIIKNNRLRFLSEREYFSEDSIFNFVYLNFCNKVSVINKSLYNHTMDNIDSITNSYNSRYNFINKWYDYIYNYAKEVGLDEKKINNRLLERYLVFLIIKIKQEVLCNKKSTKEKYRNMCKFLKDPILSDCVSNVNKYKKSLKVKILLLLIKYKLNFMIFLLILLGEVKIRK